MPDADDIVFALTDLLISGDYLPIATLLFKMSEKIEELEDRIKELEEV